MSQALDNALIHPDDDAACQSLYKLLPTGAIPTASALPVTAKACLEAFCDHTRPVRRRRWTGLILARLIGSFPEVVPHLRRAPSDLFRIGAIILGPSEVEETKIVAGLIIRAGLSQGFSFADFWSVEKAHATASMFPRDADSRWMQSFQDYLDTLLSLVPLDGPSPQLSILYPVALIGTDGFRWIGSEQSFPLLLMETHALTVITPESSLHTMQFVYIPTQRIREVECQPYDAYDSQDRHDAVQPWQVILKFYPDSPSYQVNCSQYSGSDLVIVMRHDQDARECVAETEAILSNKRTSSDNSSSLAQNKNFSEAVNEKSQMRTLSRGGIIEFNRTQGKSPIASDTQQPHQSTLDPAVNETHPAASQKNHGMLPVVNRTLHLNQPSSDPAMEYEFPNDSPSIKRYLPAKAKKTSTSRKSAAVSEASASALANLRPVMPHKRALAHDTNNEAESRVNLRDESHSSGRTTRSTRKDPTSAELPKASKSSRGQASVQQRQQPGTLNVPQGNQENNSSAKRGTKRKCAKAVTYKEDGSISEDDSTPDFAGSRKKPRGPLLKTAKKDGSSNSLKSKGMVNNRKARQPKTNKQLPQPLEKSSLANLQPELNTTSDHASGDCNPKDDGVTIQEISTTLQETQTTKASCLVEATNSGSEAHILSKLFKVDSEDGYNDEQVQIRMSKKRSSTSLTPSTPRSKRAKLDDHNADDNTESLFDRPPPTTAPPRVLEDPSSPCNSRTNGGMHAPPRPEVAIGSAMKPISPRRRRPAGSSRNQYQGRQTPVHQLGRRTRSSMSGEMLSSNSKPTPASPRAASTAISGHLDRDQMTIEKEVGEYKIEKNNPFASNPTKVNAFTRKLQRQKSAKTVSKQPKDKEGTSQQHPIELGDSPSSSASESRPHSKQTQARSNHAYGDQQEGAVVYIRSPDHPSHGRTAKKSGITNQPESTIHLPQQIQSQPFEQGDILPTIDTADMEGDTLVDFEEPKLLETHIPHVHFTSSPPPMDRSPSSHSSTSAELEPKTDPPVPKSEAEEEMEWEASLKPYQRDLRTQLIRVSNRVLRHVVDSESAVNEIADTFAQDGDRSLDLLLQEHEQEFQAVRKDVKEKKAMLKKASEEVLYEIRREREKILRDT